MGETRGLNGGSKAQGSIERNLPATEASPRARPRRKSLRSTSFGWRCRDVVTANGERREGKVDGEQLRLVTFAHSVIAKAAAERSGRGENFEGQDRLVRRQLRTLNKTPETPWSAARRNKRARLKRRKPSGRCKTVKAERGGTVAPFHPKQRQQCRSGSGLFGSKRRRGDLWTNPREAFQAVPQGLTGTRRW